MVRISHNDIGIIVASAAAGAGLTLSFPKAGWYGLAFIALVPLFWIIRDLSPKKSALAGWVFGCAHYLSLLPWILHVLHTYGYIPMVLCVPILALLAFYLALYPAVFCAILARGCKHPAYLIAAAPSLWVCLEYVRAHALSGFPWELLGYSQQPFVRIIQMTDVTGVYGLSFLIVMVNAALFGLLAHGRKAGWQGSPVSARTVLIQATAAGLCVLGALAYGELRIRQIDRLAAEAPGLAVSVIQGNIDQSLKWTPSYQSKTLEKYHDLSVRAAASSPDLIVWPETAAPFYFGHDKHPTHKLRQRIAFIGKDVLIGFPSFVQKKNRFHFYNSAHLLDRNGERLGTYSKVHLVPFGEYVPLKSLLFFINTLTEQSGEFFPGKRGETLTMEKAVLGVQICFEVIFPGLSRAMVQNGAQVLVNMTNDAWFGRSSAPYQHFSMVTFRAVENRRAVARAANTGISGFIDPVGRTLFETGLYVDAEATRTLPLLDIRTLYTRLGDLFAGLCFALLGLFWFSRKRPDAHHGPREPK
ncbi:apolipoprotein N-acyltransferase [Desulfatiferula olefinivorans]